MFGLDSSAQFDCSDFQRDFKLTGFQVRNLYKVLCFTCISFNKCCFNLLLPLFLSRGVFGFFFYLSLTQRSSLTWFKTRLQKVVLAQSRPYSKDGKKQGEAKKQGRSLRHQWSSRPHEKNFSSKQCDLQLLWASGNRTQPPWLCWETTLWTKFAFI